MMRALFLIALGLVVVALGALNVEIFRTPVEIGPIAAPGPAPVVSGTHDLPLRHDMRPLAAFQETTARPLFTQSRRPPQAKPAIIEETSAPALASHSELGDLRLAGIVQVGPTGRRALIVSRAEPAGRWLEEGAEIDGWQLVSIERLAVQIRAGGQLKQLDMN